jgi:hypothetical protein
VALNNDEIKLKAGQEYKFLVDLDNKIHKNSRPAAESSVKVGNSTKWNSKKLKKPIATRNHHHHHYNHHNQFQLKREQQSIKSKRDIYSQTAKVAVANGMRIDSYELESQKKRQLILNSHIEKDDDKSNGVCLYANIKVKINECFEKSNDCR